VARSGHHEQSERRDDDAEPPSANASIAGSLHIARRSWGSAAGGLDLAKGKQLSVDQNVERYCKEEEDECPDRSDSPFFRLVLWGVTGDGVTRQMLPVFH